MEDLCIVYFYLTIHHYELNKDYKTYHSQLNKIISLTHARLHAQSLRKPSVVGSTLNRELMGLTVETLGDTTCYLK